MSTCAHSVSFLENFQKHPCTPFGRARRAYPRVAFGISAYEAPGGKCFSSDHVPLWEEPNGPRQALAFEILRVGDTLCRPTTSRQPSATSWACSAASEDEAGCMIERKSLSLSLCGLGRLHLTPNLGKLLLIIAHASKQPVFNLRKAFLFASIGVYGRLITTPDAAQPHAYCGGFPRSLSILIQLAKPPVREPCC